ncbi:MAG: response regulator [Hyphomicrobiaceae bacterium]
MAKSVLIAEDSPVVCDIVKLFLTKNGHTATICEDGRKALEALLTQQFDVALIDYHLPELDGVEVVSLYCEAAGLRPRPRFLAMTADPEHFLASDKGIDRFETVLPKPLDIEAVVKLVESDPPARQPAITQPGPTRQAAGGRPFAELDKDFLYYPDDFSGDALRRTRMRTELQGAPDALIVTDASNVATLSSFSTEFGLHLVPVIDLSGALPGRATISTHGKPVTSGDILNVVEGFRARRQRLHPDFATTSDARHRLLARCYVNDGSLPAHLTADYRRLAVYRTLNTPEDVETLAPRLVEDRLLAPSFAHRLNVCPSCSSSRLTVWEKCHKCHSTNLREVPYVHHYRCAYQGIRPSFEHGDDLICPKCSHELLQFGKDYDLPGMAVACDECKATTSDPEIEFMCLDCSQRTPGDRILTRDVMSYTLTARGKEAAEFGLMSDGGLAAIFRFSELPLQIVAQINRMVSEAGDQARFCLGSISYPLLRHKEADHGVNPVFQTRALLLRRLQETARPHMASAGHSADYLLFKDGDEHSVRSALTGDLAALRPELSIDLEPRIDVFSHSDIL